jgi:hypothetical protein
MNSLRDRDEQDRHCSLGSRRPRRLPRSGPCRLTVIVLAIRSMSLRQRSSLILTSAKPCFAGETHRRIPLGALIPRGHYIYEASVLLESHDSISGALHLEQPELGRLRDQAASDAASSEVPGTARRKSVVMGRCSCTTRRPMRAERARRGVAARAAVSTAERGRQVASRSAFTSLERRGRRGRSSSPGSCARARRTGTASRARDRADPGRPTGRGDPRCSR